MIETLRLLTVYFGSCAVVLWLVHKTLRPIALPVALVLVLLPLTFTGKAMLTGGVWGGLNLAFNTPPLSSLRDQLPEDSYDNGILMDQVCQVIPWRKAVRESLKTGHWPLWNRFSRGGDILLGHSQPAPFDPKVWLGFLLPLATALTFACTFVFFQAACFTWLYARDLGLSSGAALVAGAIYMSSQFLTFWVGWSMSSVWAAMPLLLLGVHRLAHGTRGGFGATVAAAWLVLVGGHPESVLHVSTVALAVLLVEWPWRLGFRLAAPRIRRTLLASLAAGMLAAPALLPFVDAMLETSTFRGRSAAHIQHSLPLPEAGASAVGALFPRAWGRPAAGPISGDTARRERPKRFDAAGKAHVGGVALALALLAFGRGFARPKRWFFASLGATSLALAVGLPWVSDVFAELPLFSITLNERLAAVTAFCLAILAAFGAERLVAGNISHASARRRLAATAAGLAAAGLLQLAWAHPTAPVARGFLLSLVSLVGAPLLLALALASPPRLLRLSSTGRRRMLASLALLLVVVPRATEIPDFYRTFSPDVFFPPISEFGALPDFQSDGSEPYRVTGLYLDMVPGMSALWELEDPRGYEVMRHNRQRRTLSLWCRASHASWFCPVDDPTTPFLSAMNVRYAVGSPDLAAAADWTLVTRGEHATVWENPRVLPRAFSPHKVLRIDPGSNPPAAIAKVEDFGGVAAIEFPADGNRNFRTNPRATIRTRAEGPDLVIDVDSPQPSWIVVSETPWNGWRATTDQGHRLDLTYANVSMLAFQAPAGRHRVRLRFFPNSFAFGLLLASLAAALLGVVALLDLRRRHRSRLATPSPV